MADSPRNATSTYLLFSSTHIDKSPQRRSLYTVMSEHYTHVFRYGAKLQDGSQRWAFRFAIPDPEPRLKRGRPRALAIVFCAELRNAKGEMEFFWDASEAAIVCDAWKCYLTRFRGLRNVPWSHDSYDKASLAYLVKFNSSIEDYSPCRELNDFLKENADAICKIEATAESLTWNPDVLVHEAERSVERAREGTGNLDLNDAHAILKWAKEFKAHLKMVAEFEDYGEAKFAAETNMQVALVERAVRYASWHLPDKAHFKLAKMFDKLRARRESMVLLLAQLKAEQLELNAFSSSLHSRTEELKRERVTLSCKTGGTPNGSASGSDSHAETTTEKSTTNAAPENKTS